MTPVVTPKFWLSSYDGHLQKIISGTQYHHKLILYSSYHVPRGVLGGATKVEPGTIRVGGERPLMITGALIATTVTQRETYITGNDISFLFE